MATVYFHGSQKGPRMHYIYLDSEDVYIGPFNSHDEAEAERGKGILWINSKVVQKIPEDAFVIPSDIDMEEADGCI